jgi:pSer/pThr/pTyr-binding forkhead associated (FHA) protein
VDGIVVTLWLLRLGFLALLYLFLFAVVRILVRDLRAAVRESTTELGRLLVLASPAQEPEVGRVFRLDAVTTLGRDVNNDVVIEDPFASTDHAVLTFRGRSWYVEDLHSTNGTFVNGARVDGVAPVSFGDELQVGEVRLRLERSQR